VLAVDHAAPERAVLVEANVQHRHRPAIFQVNDDLRVAHEAVRTGSEAANAGHEVVDALRDRMQLARPWSKEGPDGHAHAAKIAHAAAHGHRSPCDRASRRPPAFVAQHARRGLRPGAIPTPYGSPMRNIKAQQDERDAFRTLAVAIVERHRGMSPDLHVRRALRAADVGP
jgi:hypothetical protein